MSVLSLAVISDARIALYGAAVAILPVIVIAVLLQFRADHSFEFLDGLLSPLAWRALGMLVGAALAIVMLLGWFQCVADLAGNRDAGTAWIRAGFGAAMIAFVLGILDALGQQTERMKSELAKANAQRDPEPRDAVPDDGLSPH